MSFQAKLTIDGEEYNILDCSFSFRQDTDVNGRPLAKPQGGRVNLLIESTSKTDFLDWMISAKQTKNGEIVFYRRDNISSLKTIKFKGAYCIDYTEQFNAHDSSPLKIHLVISANELEINGTPFKNDWPTKA